MNPIEVELRDDYLVFKDYANREIKIWADDYLKLISSPERQKYRPLLEDCLLQPTEIWWLVEEVDDKEYSYYKYIKIYKDVFFIAIILIDELKNFTLNNFYGYEKEDFGKVELERRGYYIKPTIQTKRRLP